MIEVASLQHEAVRSGKPDDRINAFVNSCLARAHEFTSSAVILFARRHESLPLCCVIQCICLKLSA